MMVLYLAFLWVATSAADPNSEFSPVQSLAQEDAAGLTGLSYNETQPPVDNPSKFEGVKIAILVAHRFEEGGGGNRSLGWSPRRGGREDTENVYIGATCVEIDPREG